MSVSRIVQGVRFALWYCFLWPFTRDFWRRYSWRRALTFFLIFQVVSFSNTQAVSAFQVPTVPGKLGPTFVRLLEERGIKMGLAVADPRIAATAAGVASVATDLAVSAAALAVAGTPIGWLGILLGGLATAGLTYYLSENGPSVKVNCLVSEPTVCMGDNLSIAQLPHVDIAMLKNQEKAPGQWDPTAPDVFYADIPGNKHCTGSSKAAVYVCMMTWLNLSLGRTGTSTNDYYSTHTLSQNGGVMYGNFDGTGGQVIGIVGPVAREYKGPDDCGSGMAVIDKTPNGANNGKGACLDPIFHCNRLCAYQVGIGIGTPLPDDEFLKDVDPGSLARILNKMWEKATVKAGYAGLPYNLTEPITVDEVKAVQAKNPSAYPKVGDLYAPVTTGAVGKANATQIGKVDLDPAKETATGQSTATNPGTATTPNQINLGADPGIKAPTLETHTWTEIIEPLFTVFPGATNMNLNLAAGACPTDSFQWQGQTFTLNQHCALLENYRALIGTIMAAIWLLAATLIIMRA